VIYLTRGDKLDVQIRYRRTSPDRVRNDFLSFPRSFDLRKRETRLSQILEKAQESLANMLPLFLPP